MLGMRNRAAKQLKIEKIERIIEAKGLRKKWIADQMAIHPNTFYAYLKGTRVPSGSIVKLLAVVLGVNEGDIAA